MAAFLSNTAASGLSMTYAPGVPQNLTMMCWGMLSSTNTATERTFIVGEPNLYLQTQADGLSLTCGTSSAFHGAYVATPGIWYHLACTCIDTSTTTRTISTYVNGQAIITGSADTATFTAYTNFQCGVDLALSGSMRDVRIWNQALSAQQIWQEYASGVPVNWPGLVAWSRFDDNLWKDDSGNGHVWSLVSTGQLLVAGPLIAPPRRRAVTLR